MPSQPRSWVSPLYNRDALVTCHHRSEQPGFLQVAYQFGIRFLVSYNELVAGAIPVQMRDLQFLPAGILIIPRHDVNLFFDSTTPDEWVSEYNYYYGPQGVPHPYWDHNLSYAEILDKGVGRVLHYLLIGDLDPVFFHQCNLRAYDGTHSLLGDLIDVTLANTMPCTIFRSATSACMTWEFSWRGG